MLFQRLPPLRGLAIVTGLALACACIDAAAADPDAAVSRYIVRFADPPLGRLNGATAATTPGATPIPRSRSANGRLRLDVRGAAAMSYVAELRAHQDRHLSDIAAAIGRVPANLRAMQHALDATILLLSSAEAQRVARIPGVAAVDADRAFELASDIGPGFTGAKALWWDKPAGADSIFAAGYEKPGVLGDGVVIGMIDSGYNSLNPSFQAIDGSGYAIRNPLGHGVYLGQCGDAGISLGGCNDKVIGVYDEVGLTAAQAGLTLSVEDVMGHGSHTASTAAGNVRVGALGAFAAPLSGVAPHANLVIFRACTPTTLCYGSAILAAVDDAIADGVVDVLNFSIADDAIPWSDPVAQAFLAATESGIGVVAAGGNGSASATGTVNNTAPWIVTVAASTHTGGALASGVRTAVQPDEQASFSLPGPARFGAVKPDLQAPGASIIAATWNDGSSGGPDRIAMMNGTSMAAAHASGSLALLLAAHPDWTPAEAKSALMLTAVESGLTRPDGITASDWFDRGAGRVQEFAASRAGLVMDENGAAFAAADPTWGDGDPGTLNLASMQDAACKNACSFTRTFRSTQDHAVNWSVAIVSGPAPGLSSVTTVPKNLPLGAFATAALKFSVKTNGLPGSVFHFAEVVLTPDDARLAPLHLVMAVAAP